MVSEGSDFLSVGVTFGVLLSQDSSIHSAWGILFGVILSEDSIISSLRGITFDVDCQRARSYLQCED